ncbi:tRNA pseudouridine(55) synthase TruB [Candidatus Saccharibacteria bacterium]|nr:tRNA pseudouridine(55) synthase TruB [Candidatus Saccharibacteria bacterium]
MEKDENQIILVDKPAGISSFGVVAKVRGYLKSQFGHKVKVGHTGTLDPFATGLLILLSGKNTKKSNEFLKKDKVYEATLKLGFTSTTGDPEGVITETTSSKHGETKTKEIGISNRQIQTSLVEGISEAAAEMERPSPVKTGARDATPKLTDVEFAVQPLTGTISQKVPQFSAIKIDGERAYKLARAGKSFDTPTRTVTIYSIEILDYSYPFLTIRTHVSSGTYIRTLAEDIGEKLGTGAYLTALRRIKIADYQVSDAHPLSDFTN